MARSDKSILALGGAGRSSWQEPLDLYAGPGGHDADGDADDGVRQAENGPDIGPPAGLAEASARTPPTERKFMMHDRVEDRAAAHATPADLSVGLGASALGQVRADQDQP
jgi:hypothetical protein